MCALTTALAWPVSAVLHRCNDTLHAHWRSSLATAMCSSQPPPPPPLLRQTPLLTSRLPVQQWDADSWAQAHGLILFILAEVWCVCRLVLQALRFTGRLRQIDCAGIIGVDKPAEQQPHRDKCLLSNTTPDSTVANAANITALTGST